MENRPNVTVSLLNRPWNSLFSCRRLKCGSRTFWKFSRPDESGHFPVLFFMCSVVVFPFLFCFLHLKPCAHEAIKTYMLLLNGRFKWWRKNSERMRGNNGGAVCVFQVKERERWVEELPKIHKGGARYIFCAHFRRRHHFQRRCADGNELLIDHIIVGGRCCLSSYLAVFRFFYTLPYYCYFSRNTRFPIFFFLKRKKWKDLSISHPENSSNCTRFTHSVASLFLAVTNRPIVLNFHDQSIEWTAIFHDFSSPISPGNRQRSVVFVCCVK